MKINEKGINLLHKYEGLRLDAYLCPANVWTIGFGNTRYEDGTPVKQGDKITNDRAKELFNNIIIKHFETGVIKSVKTKLNDNQFSALVSFTYNIGLGNFRSSTLLKLVNENPNNPKIKDQFLRWNKAGGKILNGLISRRKEEAELYFSID